MKFLAILKDSLREALDSKVFAVMVGLSLVVTLLVASMSFQPQPVTALKHALETTLDQDAQQAFGRPNLFEIRGAEPLEGSLDRPSGSYRFTVRAQFFEADEAAPSRPAPETLLAFLRDHFASVEDWKVYEAVEVRPARDDNPFRDPPGRPGDVDFEVTARPTPATLYVWPHASSLLFGLLPLSELWNALLQMPTPPLGFQLWFIEDYVIMGAGAWLGLLVSVALTAFFIPNMLQKGAVDLLLVKPVRRWALLVYKYLGGLTFISVNTAFVVVCVWLALGLRSGVWAPGFLLTILVLAFYFAVLYAVSTLFGVLTRNPIVALLMTCLFWGMLYGIGRTYREVAVVPPVPPGGSQPEGADTPDDWSLRALKVAHFVLPRTDDLNPLTTRLIAGGLLPEGQVRTYVQPAPVRGGESLAISSIYIVLFLALACWHFSAKDY
jgi:ABC-2 family transporter protein